MLILSAQAFHFYPKQCRCLSKSQRLHAKEKPRRSAGVFQFFRQAGVERLSAPESGSGTILSGLLRIVKELFWFVLFHDLACIHEDHPVGHLTGKAHFVGHTEHGHAFFGQFDHCIKHLFDHLRIKRRCRFIKQHDAGAHAQRPGNRHTLLLTTGQLTRVFVGLFWDFHLFQESASPFLRLLSCGVLRTQIGAKRAVFQNGQMREQVKVLEAHANLGPDLVDVLEVRGQQGAIHRDGPFLVLLQCVDTADQRGFT